MENDFMADYDEQGMRLTIKLVFYGPALSGKTTNLTYLHDTLNPEMKGDMMIMETKNDRTLFFDLLPLGLKSPSGLLIKLKLFTVPGQVEHDSTRKAVLSRADGIVFVADSQITQGINNAESFKNLAQNVVRVGLDFETLPVVVQFNKRDLKQIQSEGEILERWQKTNWPVLFACALKGTGAIETFKTLLQRVFDKMDIDYQLSAQHQLSRDSFVEGFIGSTHEQV
jgi:GTPase SAR1 family protein